MKNIGISLVALALITCSSRGTEAKKTGEKLPENWDIAFYNVENLFDTEDDPKTSDEDFTPAGKLEWSQARYEEKIQHISKVLQAMGKDHQAPAIIGLSEVENEKVVMELANTLKPDAYGVVHRDSPDKRGIDVALLYEKAYFELVQQEFLRVSFEEQRYTSREILYANLHSKGDNEDLHIFVNHWPSRRGGQLETEIRRMAAANTLRIKLDEVIAKDPEAQIIIMGDFNDYPDNRSLVYSVGAVPKDTEKKGELVNLAFELEMQDKGTYNYKGDWGMLDQMIISDALLKVQGLTTSETSLEIFQQDFMMYFDKKYNESYPNKTYSGDKYYGGYSDHLPICLRMKNTNQAKRK